ncbi:MAG: CDP-glucose 4,6-dehydratase [bacterium]|nr:CDP-glucose 4,6-dehydratase [bacterium]
MLFNNIYKNRKVLVTGHTGFKGSWLALWLKQVGADVLGYSLEPNTNPNHFSLIDCAIESAIGDICDTKKLHAAFNTFKPEIVFHLAAQTIVRASYADPVETFKTNVMGTLNIFEACKNAGSVKALINITSDKCYENKEWDRGYRENDPLGGYDPYSASKGCSEILTSSYRNSFFNPEQYGTVHTTLLASARAGNVIGGGDWARDRLIPDIMRTLENKKKVIIRYPDAIRPWQHVLEPLSGYLHLGQKLLEGQKQYAGPWNFGPQAGEELRVSEVIQYIKRSLDTIQYNVETNPKNPHEANILRLDSTKANTLLNWNSLWTSKISLDKTIKWYKTLYEEKNVISSSQLNEYIEDAMKSGLDWAK